MKSFEYKMMALSEMKNENSINPDVKKLNELGEEGWELILISNGQCIFKREVAKFELEDIHVIEI